MGTYSSSLPCIFRARVNEVLHHPLETIEMNWVARNIRERGISPGECAILSRNIKLLQVAAKSLHKAELIPYRNERKSEFEYPLLCFCRSLIPKSHIASMTNLHLYAVIRDGICGIWTISSGNCARRGNGSSAFLSRCCWGLRVCI